MHSELLTITPNEASKYLANNPANRKINESVVRAMAEDMKAGRWMQTHQGIAISKTGRLLDGQHRLSAVIKKCDQYFEHIELKNIICIIHFNII